MAWSATDNSFAHVPVTIGTSHVESECFLSNILVTSMKPTIDYLFIVNQKSDKGATKRCPVIGSKTAKLVLEVMDGAGNVVATCEAVAWF